MQAFLKAKLCLCPRLPAPPLEDAPPHLLPGPASSLQFAHGREELRPVVRHPKYKTEVCRRAGRDGCLLLACILVVRRLGMAALLA